MIKYLFSMLGILSVVFNCYSFGDVNKSYLEPDAPPVITIIQYELVEDNNSQFVITISIKAGGNTPISFSINQLTGFIENGTDMYDIYFHFDEELNKIIVKPNEDKIITLYSSTIEKIGFTEEEWASKKSGVFNLIVNYGSGKTAQFDYQWLGSMVSNEVEVILK